MLQVVIVRISLCSCSKLVILKHFPGNERWPFYQIHTNFSIVTNVLFGNATDIQGGPAASSGMECFFPPHSMR